MLDSANRFVAYVAEKFLAFKAIKGIALGLFLIDSVAFWAFSAESDINIVIVFSDSSFIFHLLSNIVGLKDTLETFARRILFEMFLAFGSKCATPAEPFITSLALNMRASCVCHQLIVLSAFWTGFGTMLEINCIEQYFCFFVPGLNILNLLSTYKLLM